MSHYSGLDLHDNWLVDLTDCFDLIGHAIKPAVVWHGIMRLSVCLYLMIFNKLPAVPTSLSRLDRLTGPTRPLLEEPRNFQQNYFQWPSRCLSASLRTRALRGTSIPSWVIKKTSQHGALSAGSWALSDLDRKHPDKGDQWLGRADEERRSYIAFQYLSNTARYKATLQVFSLVVYSSACSGWPQRTVNHCLAPEMITIIHHKGKQKIFQTPLFWG